MNILFLTLVYPEGENASNLYVDLMRELKENGNNIYVATSLERRNNKKTSLSKQQGINVLRVKTGNIQKTNIIEKGISTLLIENQFVSAIKKYFFNVRFDLIIYSTPPITFSKVINMIKKRDNAKSYLLLKDIFPQNAVDMEMFKESSILHKIFLKKERQLYLLSDYIGCMSEKNRSYLLEHNNYLDEVKIEVCPNSIKPKTIGVLNYKEKSLLKEKYNIPNDALTIVYGGNLGKPQGIDFLIDIIKANKKREDIYFLIIGSGTEYGKLNSIIELEKPVNTVLKSYLPKQEYEELLRLADVGLILLDKRFTIPNFPSRLLSYMEFSLPVIAATDVNTDINKYIYEGDFGAWCESGNLIEFNKLIDWFLGNRELLINVGKNSRKYLEKNYNVEKSSEIILSHFKNN